MTPKRMPCRSNKARRCQRKSGFLDYYEEIVAAYIQEFRPRAEAELSRFKNCKSLEEAIARAAWCMTRDGKRHPHHARRSEHTLETAERVLQARIDDIRRCKTFDELHKLVCREIYPIKWVKKLYAYDVATWIGAYLDLQPELIYLHAGTAIGAAALGQKTKGPLNPATLPEAFQRLRVYEIEDCLCIYKNDLPRIANSIFSLFN